MQQATKDEKNTVSVTIGDNDTVTYHIRQTRAPKDYDGFGTIELANYGNKDGRLVLIRDEHYDWQTNRYSSGIFACWLPDYADRTVVSSELWRRILGVGQRP